jgi:hypothetical protein
VTADIKVVLFYARVWEAWSRVRVPEHLHERFFNLNLHYYKGEEIPTLPMVFWIGGKERDGNGRPPMRLSKGIEFSADSLETFNPISLDVVPRLAEYLQKGLDAFIGRVAEYDSKAA